MSIEKLEEMHEAQKKHTEELVEIKIILAEHKLILAENTKILEEHQKRTRVSEDRLEQLEDVLYKHLHMVKGAIYLLSALATLATIVIGAAKFL